MAISSRDRRALIIFGVVVAVAAAAFFLIPKATKKTSENLPPRVGPTVAPSPTVSPAPKPKASPKQVLVFSGRDPFDPSQGGGTIAPAAFTSPTPTAASGAVLVLVDLALIRSRRRTRRVAGAGRRPASITDR